jgi:hypothetical protein
VVVLGTKSETGPKLENVWIFRAAYVPIRRYIRDAPLMILRGSRTSRSVFGVPPVPAEVRPLRPRTMLLSFAVFWCSTVASRFVSFPRLVRQTFRKA